MFGNINSPGMAAAAMAAMLLSACMGGGGSGGGPPGVSNAGVSGTFGQGARGVSVEVTHNGSAAAYAFTKGGTAWTDDPSTAYSAITGWSGSAKANAPAGSETERIAAYADIAGAADDDYLVFGYWNSIANGIPQVAAPFYWGSKPYEGDVKSSLRTASVTYTGEAAGVYNMPSQSARGYFQSSVQLVADFGVGTISGALSSFTYQTTGGVGAPGDPGAVSLADINFNGPSFSSGTWSGMFFGPSGADPTGVAGVFGVTVETNFVALPGQKMSLTGAFGAKR